MSSLFGGAGQGQGGVGGDGGLHSFKAGRCDYDSSTNTVTPVATKGSLFIQACFALHLRALNLRAFFLFPALSPSLSLSCPPSPVFVLPPLLSSSVGTPGLALAYVCLRSGVVRVVNVLLSLEGGGGGGKKNVGDVQLVCTDLGALRLWSKTLCFPYTRMRMRMLWPCAANSAPDCDLGNSDLR
jgi:hypothetical protein